MDRIQFNERSSGSIAFDVQDALGVGVPAAALTAATLTLYDMETGNLDASPIMGILNGRDAQNVLNANNVAIDSSGHVVWSVQAADNVVVTKRRQVERHRAMFHFAWPTGAFNYEIEIVVRNFLMAS